MVALAASRHAVPFVVLTGLHKLSPLFPHDPDVTLNDLKSPAQLLDFDAIADSLPQDGEGVGPDLHVPNPALDYVPPALVSLFITDSGCHCPSYVYRLLQEYYSPEDMDLNAGSK
jgi:translation initiation factor eIF-2B subunit beta